MSRVMGLDVGDKRIGISVSDELRFTAQPLEVYTRRGPRQDVAYIARKAEELAVEEIIVGIPYKMAGGMSTMGERILSFTEQLKTESKARVLTRDERLSTVEANRSMLEGDLSRSKRKAKIDVIAAQLILQGYLDSLAIKKEAEEERRRWGDD
jgi:putative holliday junction resolvase